MRNVSISQQRLSNNALTINSKTSFAAYRVCLLQMRFGSGALLVLGTWVPKLTKTPYHHMLHQLLSLGKGNCSFLHRNEMLLSGSDTRLFHSHFTVVASSQD